MSDGRNDDEIVISPADVYVGPTSSLTNVGYIEEAVAVRLTDHVILSRANQTGRTPIRAYEGGQEIRVELIMKQSEAENLGLALNSATVSAGPTSKSVKGGGKPGTVITPQRLWIHDANNATTDLTEDLVIHKAIKVDGPIEMRYGPEDEKLVALVYEGIIDDSESAGEQLYEFGVDQS